MTATSADPGAGRRVSRARRMRVDGYCERAAHERDRRNPYSTVWIIDHPRRISVRATDAAMQAAHPSSAARIPAPAPTYAITIGRQAGKVRSGDLGVVVRDSRHRRDIDPELGAETATQRDRCAGQRYGVAALRWGDQQRLRRRARCSGPLGT